MSHSLATLPAFSIPRLLIVIKRLSDTNERLPGTSWRGQQPGGMMAAVGAEHVGPYLVR